MDLAPMQALTMSRQLAFSGGCALPGFLISLAAFPAQAALAPLLDTALCIIVFWIGRAPLSFHLALQAAHGLRIRIQFLAEHRKVGLFLTWHDGDTGRTKVQPNRLDAYRMFRLLMGHPFQRELHHIAKPSRIRPRGTLTAGMPLHQAGIFDALAESMGDHLIFPIDHGFQLVMLPDQKASIALLWLVQHEAQSGIVAFVLQAPQSSSPALEAHAARFSHTDAVEGLIGTRRQGLGHHCT